MENSNYITSDIGIAAFLQLHGIKLVNCKRLENGKFEDSAGVCKSKSLDFLESDFCKFDNIVRNLKKVLFS